jgi:hypothetical protein
MIAPIHPELALGIALALESTEAEIELARTILRETSDIPMSEDRAFQILSRAKRRMETVRLALGADASANSVHGGTDSHFVELGLAPESYPNRCAVASLLEGISRLGALECIELAIAPEGGGRLCFIVHGEVGTEPLRERLLALLSGGSITCCRPLPIGFKGAA